MEIFKKNLVYLFYILAILLGIVIFYLIYPSINNSVIFKDRFNYIVGCITVFGFPLIFAQLIKNYLDTKLNSEIISNYVGPVDSTILVSCIHYLNEAQSGISHGEPNISKIKANYHLFLQIYIYHSNKLKIDMAIEELNYDYFKRKIRSGKNFDNISKTRYIGVIIDSLKSNNMPSNDLVNINELISSLITILERQK